MRSLKKSYYQNYFFLSLLSFLLFLFVDSNSLQKQTRDVLQKGNFAKKKGKNLKKSLMENLSFCAVKDAIRHWIFDSFPKDFITAVFKSKYCHGVMRSKHSKVLWEITVLARFVKLGGKRSIVKFNFSKIVSQKYEAVIHMEHFLNVSLEILKNL